MLYLDFTLPSPAENLACDEALLDLCETTPGLEVLRCWEPATCFVVLGYGNHASLEANLPACKAGQVPILRRVSGGGTVLQGPGCLNYSLLLQIDQRPGLESIAATNRYILERQAEALAPLVAGKVAWRGSTDLTMGPMKFAGNAQRRRQRSLLFHGSLLLKLDLALLDTYLAHPSREPEYREGRSHGQFVQNLGLEVGSVKGALRRAWHASEELREIPRDAINLLVRDKYADPAWNLKF
jgi:lipoate-protein ligase A